VPLLGERRRLQKSRRRSPNSATVRWSALLDGCRVDKRICKPHAAAVKQWHVPRSSFAVPRLNASRFRELVSGERQGVTANILRSILRVVEAPYSSAVAWRNRQYDRGRKEVQRVGVPVISVGNLTLGGTGKTPMVEWLARWFLDRGVRVAIVSRGYGSKAGSSNDEALELAEKLPGVPHVQNPDRVAAARAAIAEHNCRLILLDDAFQHRRIHRDIDIVLLDALEPFGYGHLFPRGMLREPLSSLRRADVVALSRADLIDGNERSRIQTVVRRHAPDALWIECSHAPRELRSASGKRAEIASLANRKVAAFCGIGNPAGFRRTLSQCDFSVAAFREFADHHSYEQSDLDSLGAWASSLAVEALVCTQKDLVKIGVDRVRELPLWAIAIGLDISLGQAELEPRLQDLLAPVKR
jgi:tetraacyldisaccharide 4'-kinase